MRKNYITPAITVILLSSQHAFLTGSETKSLGSGEVPQMKFDSFNVDDNGEYDPE